MLLEQFCMPLCRKKRLINVIEQLINGHRTWKNTQLAESDPTVKSITSSQQTNQNMKEKNIKQKLTNNKTNNNITNKQKTNKQTKTKQTMKQTLLGTALSEQNSWAVMWWVFDMFAGAAKWWGLVREVRLGHKQADSRVFRCYLLVHSRHLVLSHCSAGK